MYEYVKGILMEKGVAHTVVDVGGIGYKLQTPLSALEKLPQEKKEVLLYASWVVRETSQTLYGFCLKEERDVFEILITVSGIGPRTALNLIGHLGIENLKGAVRTQNVLALSKVPGIGKKSAERLIIELQTKFKVGAGVNAPSLKSGKLTDALQALMNLGYSQSSAEKAVEKASQDVSEESDLATLITAALKYRK